MRFMIYRNSFPATVCSLFGGAFMALGVMSLLQGGTDILSAILFIAVGAGLTWLAMVISDKKEQKKKAKSQAAAQTASAAAVRSAARSGISDTARAQAAPRNVPGNVQKEMEACKDLLDCGILTQEEYDQKIRDLMRG